MDAIATNRLGKSYAGRPALHDVTLRVRSGSLFGFLGPNGAGKTTVLRVLAGLLRPTVGHATVLGGDTWHDGPRIRREIGFLPGEIRLYEHLTGRQTLHFLDAARGGGHTDEIRRLAEVFDLDLTTRVRKYSRGMKQKLGLVQTLMHRPRVLLMDEPTTALDPLMRGQLYRELRAVAADGRTVLFSSHTLSEVDELCDEVAIVRAGRLVECERIAVLRQRALRRVSLRMPPGLALNPPDGLRVLECRDGSVRATWTGAVQPLLSWLADVGVDDVTLAAPDLEDLFMTYYVDPTGEAAS